jgi:hypothetical protein
MKVGERMPVPEVRETEKANCVCAYQAVTMSEKVVEDWRDLTVAGTVTMSE